MFKKIVITSIFSAVFLLQGCSDNKTNKIEEANEMISSNEFILTTLDKKQIVVKKDGNGFILPNDKDKVVIFDIFATWCPPCRAEATHLSSLQSKYKNDLKVIGITIEDMVADEKLKEFAQKYDARYTLVNSLQNRRLVDEIALALKVGERFPIPMMAMYKNGKLINYYLGATQEEFIESDIKKALDK